MAAWSETPRWTGKLLRRLLGLLGRRCTWPTRTESWRQTFWLKLTAIARGSTLLVLCHFHRLCSTVTAISRCGFHVWAGGSGSLALVGRGPPTVNFALLFLANQTRVSGTESRAPAYLPVVSNVRPCR